MSNILQDLKKTGSTLIWTGDYLTIFEILAILQYPKNYTYTWFYVCRRKTNMIEEAGFSVNLILRS